MYVSLKESLISNTRNIQGGNTSVVVKDLTKIVDQEIINKCLNHQESRDIKNIQATLQEDKVIFSEIDKVSSMVPPELVIDFDSWSTMKLPKHIVFDIPVGEFHINDSNKAQKINGYTFDTKDNGNFMIHIRSHIKSENIKIKNCTFITRLLGLDLQYPAIGMPPYYAIRNISRGSTGKNKTEIIPNNTYLNQLRKNIFNSSNKIVLYDDYLQKGQLWFLDFGITIPMEDIQEGNLPVGFLKSQYVKGSSKFDDYQRQFKNTRDSYGDLHADKYPFNLKLSNLMGKQIRRDLVDKLAGGSSVSEISLVSHTKNDGVFMSYTFYENDIERW